MKLSIELSNLIIIVILSVTLLFFPMMTFEKISNHRVKQQHHPESLELPWISNAEGHVYPYTATVISLVCMMACMYAIITCAAKIHMWRSWIYWCRRYRRHIYKYLFGITDPDRSSYGCICWVLFGLCRLAACRFRLCLILNYWRFSIHWIQISNLSLQLQWFAFCVYNWECTSDD